MNTNVINFDLGVHVEWKKRNGKDVYHIVN